MCWRQPKTDTPQYSIGANRQTTLWVQKSLLSLVKTQTFAMKSGVESSLSIQQALQRTGLARHALKLLIGHCLLLKAGPGLAGYGLNPIESHPVHAGSRAPAATSDRSPGPTGPLADIGAGAGLARQRLAADGHTSALCPGTDAWQVGRAQGLALFARKLETVCQVMLLEMPWSGRRAYDQRYTVALKEISAQVQTLRGKGYRQVPVLWVIGTQDPLYPAGEAYADAKLPAHAKSRYLVVDAGHGNTPEVAATGVIEWLKGLE